MRIGIDDTDSPGGMCTTYLGALLAEKLESEGFCITERILVRLNPNAPFKTRGNAAICIVAEEKNQGDKEKAFSFACSLVDEYAEFECEKTNPGVVVCNAPVSHSFYKKALQDFCTIEEAEELLIKSGALYKGWKVKRGLIGATAAVSAEFEDFTFEVLAYRSPFSKGLRQVSRDTIFLAEKMTCPHTWDSVDLQNNVVVCVPHTPDPVLFGIRGESPEWVIKARSYIRSEEPEREIIYKTNQGTDAHLVDSDIAHMLQGRSYRVKGIVSKEPSTGEGGHVSFEIIDPDFDTGSCDLNSGSSLRCMAYEPTKGFRDVIRALRPGDMILVCGSFKNESINLEKIFVESLAEDIVKKPPVCPDCNKRMTSAGKEKGYKCRVCGKKAFEPEIITSERTIALGWYEVPPVARRHLSMPLVRRNSTKTILWQD
ncbi:MAG: tRNA(Ile)(2)-agmatinylcytidine synthase [Methanomicrobium sp.]|nr:tRNA(Ile)(2)-agmatinylcytidine synthase [Methanomicrobium sp.]